MTDLNERVAVVEQRQDTTDRALRDQSQEMRDLTALVNKLVSALSSLKGAAWMVAVLWPVLITGTMIAIRIWK